MKATQGTTYRMLNDRLNNLTTQLEELRKIGATGIKLDKPSDDPASIRPVLNTKKQLSNVDRYLETMGQSLDKLQATDGHLEHVEYLLQSVKETAINAVNGIMDGPSLQILADQIGHLRDELFDASNATVDGKYIFSGYEEDTQPFSVNGAYVPGAYDPNNNATWPYIYNGDANPINVEITPGETLQISLTGADLFFGDADNNGQVDPGRVNIFATVTNLMEAVEAGDVAGIELEMDNLDIAADQNRRLRSQMGNRASRLEDAMTHQESVRVDLKQILSRYQDADAIESFNNIIQQETAFQAALSITGKVSQLSILDFI
jgi:flagellar hook-associated protein 3 FlgL